MNLIVFEKTFDIKIMTFPLAALETLGHYCIKKKLIKSRDPWKSKSCQIPSDITFASLKCFLSCYKHEQYNRLFSVMYTFFLLYVL